MSLSSRRSLTGGGGEPQGEKMVATVKGVIKAPNSSEQKVKIRQDNSRVEDAIYVPKKFVKNLKPEHKYEFHLEETTFRGGSQSRLSGSGMLRRTKVEPTQVKAGGFRGSSSTAGTGFRSR